MRWFVTSSSASADGVVKGLHFDLSLKGRLRPADEGWLWFFTDPELSLAGTLVTIQRLLRLPHGVFAGSILASIPLTLPAQPSRWGAFLSPLALYSSALWLGLVVLCVGCKVFCQVNIAPQLF